jgi:hypothetical protein
VLAHHHLKEGPNVFAHAYLTQKAVEQILDSVQRCITRLMKKRQLDPSADDDFQTIRSMLKASSLPDYVLGLVSKRLRKARKYLLRSEAGRARNELTLVASTLGRDRHNARTPLRSPTQNALDCGLCGN